MTAAATFTGVSCLDLTFMNRKYIESEWVCCVAVTRLSEIWTNEADKSRDVRVSTWTSDNSDSTLHEAENTNCETQRQTNEIELDWKKANTRNNHFHCLPCFCCRSLSLWLYLFLSLLCVVFVFMKVFFLLGRVLWAMVCFLHQFHNFLASTSRG